MHETPPRLEPPIVLSVIVPVLHEAATINEHVDHVKKTAATMTSVSLEIIIVDPADDTLAALADRHADVVRAQSRSGRARQMNAGAEAASGEILLFLHADTRLPDGGLQLVADTLGPAVAAARLGEGADGLSEAGAFTLAFADGGLVLKLFALGGGLRNRLTRTPYGDQAQFFTARLFRELGGYPDIPLMEDVAIMHALKRTGRRPAILPASVRTSTRRYREQGVLYAGVRNNILRLLYGVGVPAHKLATHYRRKGARA